MGEYIYTPTKTVPEPNKENEERNEWLSGAAGLKGCPKRKIPLAWLSHMGWGGTGWFGLVWFGLGEDALPLRALWPTGWLTGCPSSFGAAQLSPTALWAPSIRLHLSAFLRNVRIYLLGPPLFLSFFIPYLLLRWVIYFPILEIKFLVKSNNGLRTHQTVRETNSLQLGGAYQPLTCNDLQNASIRELKFAIFLKAQKLLCQPSCTSGAHLFSLCFFFKRTTY